MSFLRDSYPIADKSHHCVHCVERISPGTKHIRVVGNWSGDWNDWRAHLECQSAMERTRRDQGEYYDDELCDMKHLRGLSCREMEIRRAIISQEPK